MAEEKIERIPKLTANENWLWSFYYDFNETTTWISESPITVSCSCGHEHDHDSECDIEIFMCNFIPALAKRLNENKKGIQNT